MRDGFEVVFTRKKKDALEVLESAVSSCKKRGGDYVILNETDYYLTKSLLVKDMYKGVKVELEDIGI